MAAMTTIATAVATALPSGVFLLCNLLLMLFNYSCCTQVEDIIASCENAITSKCYHSDMVAEW